MENGDLRAVVRYLLPLHNPNCTYHMRLHADRRDPPLPPALHVSTQNGLGGKPGVRSAELGQVAPDEPAHAAPFTFGAAAAAAVPDVQTQTQFASLSVMLLRYESHKAHVVVVVVVGSGI